MFNHFFKILAVASFMAVRPLVTPFFRNKYLCIHRREVLDAFFTDSINHKNHINMNKSQYLDEESKAILRQIGFGAVLGIAFLATVYLGGLIAHLVSGM